MAKPFFHHRSAFVESLHIGKNTKIWHNAHIRKGSKIGEDCVIGKNAYIDKNVVIGNKVKIQNNVSVYDGVVIEDGAFIGPHVCFTNEHNPRSITAGGKLKGVSDWSIAKTRVKYGASLGANSTIVCGTTIGRYAMIGAGSVVTKDVADYALAYGNPAAIKGYVCKCGADSIKNKSHIKCTKCNLKIKIKLG